MPSNLDQLKALKKSYLSTFNSESGKKVLKDLERHCFIKGTTFSEKSLRMAFNEGQRSIYLHVNTMMNFDFTNLEDKDEKPSL